MDGRPSTSASVDAFSALILPSISAARRTTGCELRHHLLPRPERTAHTSAPSPRRSNGPITTPSITPAPASVPSARDCDAVLLEPCKAGSEAEEEAEGEGEGDGGGDGVSDGVGNGDDEGGSEGEREGGDDDEVEGGSEGEAAGGGMDGDGGCCGGEAGGGDGGGGVEGGNEGGGGGACGGGSGGPTMVVVVDTADVLIPSEAAREVGARAEDCDCECAWASEEEDEPAVTTVTSASIESTAVVTPVMSASLTPRSDASVLVLTVGAARLPELEALSSRRTLKLAALEVCRLRARCLTDGSMCACVCSCRRATKTTEHCTSPAHRAASSACAMRSADTPAGKLDVTVDVWTTNTCTFAGPVCCAVPVVLRTAEVLAIASPTAPPAACDSALMRVPTSIDEATDAEMATTDVVAYETGAKGGGCEGGGGACGGGGAGGGVGGVGGGVGGEEGGGVEGRAGGVGDAAQSHPPPGHSAKHWLYHALCLKHWFGAQHGPLAPWHAPWCETHVPAGGVDGGFGGAEGAAQSHPPPGHSLRHCE